MTMKLPHIKNSQVAQDVAEAVTTNLYQMLITPPSGIVAPDWLVDEIVSIGGLDAVDKIPEIIKQQARGHNRAYHAVFIDDTTIELTLVINLNAHGPQALEIPIYKAFKSWARRVRNEDTGSNSLKINTVGGATLDQFNKIGEVWRKLEFKRVLLGPITGLDEAALASDEPVSLNVTLVCEEFKVTYSGDALQV